MKKSELKQLIREVIKESIFNRNPDYVDALKKDPSTSKLWNKLQHGKS
jgi:hypothetical protein